MSEVDRQRLRALQTIAERLAAIIERERRALATIDEACRPEGRGYSFAAGVGEATIKLTSDELAQLAQLAFDHAAASNEGLP